VLWGTLAADELFPAAGRQGYSLRARSNQNGKATGVGRVLAQKEINS
jgi:hypothetical protein